jgi:hypothetical protein
MVRSSFLGAEPPCMTAIEREPMTVPTAQAVRVVLQVAALLVLGTWGVLYFVAFLLWVYWR